MEEKSVNSPGGSRAFELFFERRPAYLYARVAGQEDSYEISRQFWQEIADECRRLDCKKVLIVEEIVMEAPLHDVYQLASELPHMGFRGVKVAFVDRLAEDRQINEFGALVATNRGFHGQIFNDFDEAEKWLLRD